VVHCRMGKLMITQRDVQVFAVGMLLGGFIGIIIMGEMFMMAR